MDKKFLRNSNMNKKGYNICLSKRFAIVSILVITVLTLSACKSDNIKEDEKVTVQTNEPNYDDEQNTDDGSIQDTNNEANKTAQVDDGWKQAYIDILNKEKPKSEDEAGNWSGFDLIYVDDNDVPELAMKGICEAQGCTIVTYANGKTNELILSRLGADYKERKGLICNSDGHMDAYYDNVYSLTDGKFEQIAAGEYGAENNSNVQVDEEGFPIYVYFWNNESVTEEDYATELGKIYSKEDSIYIQESYTADEIIEKIGNL